MSLLDILYSSVPVLVGVLGYLGKSYMNKISKIEEELDTKLSEQQTRQILSDRLDPIKESVEEVKEKLDKLYDLLLK